MMPQLSLRLQPVNTANPPPQPRYANLWAATNGSETSLRRIYESQRSQLAVNIREPPRKKRRVAADEERVAEDNYAVVAQCTIELTFTEHDESPFVEGNAVPVQARLIPFSDDGGRTLGFGLGCLGNGQLHPFRTGSTDKLEAARFIQCAEIGSMNPFAIVSTRLQPPAAVNGAWRLHIEVKWRKDFSPNLQLPNLTSGGRSEECERLLQSCVPPSEPQYYGRHRKHVLWSPKQFYEHVHVPLKSTNQDRQLSPASLTCSLYPFQQRAVHWLLSREGVEVGSVQGEILPVKRANDNPISFEPYQSATGDKLLVSHLFNQVIDAEGAQDKVAKIQGGILAEEMGLGKTVELISLIMLHQRHEQSGADSTDIYTSSTVKTCNATLIITPPSILEQWKNELARHAPNLQVLHYKGVKHTKQDDATIVKKLMHSDVVLTTYAVLASEIHYAQDPPDRSRRSERKYEQRRSPLVMLQWWRVCLDEAQMIESGVSNAATVARLIPRVNAWAVSGTPVKKDVKDLHGLLIFLRFYPFSDARIWKRMMEGDPAYLAQLFGQIAMRHSKNAVREELGIPAQKRIVITVPFTAIEESNYNHLYQQMCDDCGLNSEGGPLSGLWDPDDPVVVEKMRTWLQRLRQTCLHAEIGARNRRALGRGNGPLRTVDEVLEVLIEQNETALRVEERTTLLARVMQGHLLSFGKETQEGLEVYLAALREASEAVNECRQQVKEEQTKLKQSNVKNETSSSSDTDIEDEVDERRARLLQYQQRLRSALEVQHICAFFAGTAYFQLKDKLPEEEAESELFKSLEKKETECYDLAKTVRRELLTEVSRKTNHFLERLSALKKRSFVELPTVKHNVNLEGIESRKVIDNIEILADLLNEQTARINEWRTKYTDFLLSSLVDQDDEVEMTGEEYEASTKLQDTQYVLHEALRAAIADRHALLTGQVNFLVDGELKGAYKQAVNGAADEPDNKGPDPDFFKRVIEERELFIQKFRKPYRPGKDVEPPFLSARSLMTEIRSLITAVQWQQGMRSNRAEAEVQILERHLDSLQHITNIQIKALATLEQELGLFRDTMNQRLEFYKQLQAISDQVAPFQEEMSEEVDMQNLEKAQTEETKHAEKLAGLKTKRRFLTHLRAESSGQQESRICIICQGTFEIGVLTVCGHQYCKECIRIWWRQKQTCPMCKRHLKTNEFHEITYKPQELRAQEEVHAGSSPTTSPTKTSEQHNTSIYTSVSATTLDAIKSIDLPTTASYGTKIDLICRTLLYLRSHDPGSKSIIFSQYRDFLQVLASALKGHRIGYSAISDKNGITRFREDASVECFLLHAKADSSGLNLVNATHVFLCEPLINAAIELQAIARVHRIGQRRETTVWMFLVQDTVEEAIYEISVRRRLAHMQRSIPTIPHAEEDPHLDSMPSTTGATFEEKTLDAANSLELQAAPLAQLMTKGQSGGEVVGKDDLWTCLFGRRRQKAGAALADAGADVGGVVGEEVGRFLRAEAAAGRADAEGGRA